MHLVRLRSILATARLRIRPCLPQWHEDDNGNSGTGECGCFISGRVRGRFGGSKYAQEAEHVENRSGMCDGNFPADHWREQRIGTVCGEENFEPDCSEE